MVHWDDVKANIKEMLSELKNQKIGIVGLGLITVMVLIGAFAPMIAPGANAHWTKTADRWAENPKRAPPVWVDWLTMKDYAHHKTVQSYDFEKAGSIHTITFTRQMDSDVPPKDVYLRIDGEAESLNQIRIDVIRPDKGKGMAKWSRIVDKDLNKKGSFHMEMTFQRGSNFRDYAYTEASQFLISEYGMAREDLTSRVSMDPTATLFGKPNKDLMSSPDVLKGEYKIKIRLIGEGIQMDEKGTSATFSGAVFGLMGTDGGRRDIWQGWVWGARYGLIAGGIVALTTIIFSTLFGMTSAYYGGWVDEAMQRLNEIMMGIPALPILIILLMWRKSIWIFILVYALLMWRGAAKVIRSRGLQVAKDTYIEASEALGASSSRIIRKHMIPQILPYSFAQAALLIPIVIMAEAGLHILGLGDGSIVTWGTILSDANSSHAMLNFKTAWWWIILPGIGMVLVGFGFIATGMAIERIINPKMKQR